MQSFNGVTCGDHTIVFFDLETTGFPTDRSGCDIVQLSAVVGGRSFDRYLLPRCSISDGASRVNGLTVGQTAHGPRLFHLGRPVDTAPLGEALSSFVHFLRGFRRPLLAAHNAVQFDGPILVRAMGECGLGGELQQAACGFLDTLPLSRELFTLPRYSMDYLVSGFLGTSYRYQAHNALEDAKALQELFQLWNPPQQMVQRNVFPL